MGTQTHLSGEDILALQMECNNLHEDIRTLKVKKIFQFDVESFTEENDGNERVKYFTGLPSVSVLMTLFNFLLPALKKKCTLTPFQQVLLVLMRVRLNLNIQFLGLCFGVSKPTASKTFSDVIDALFDRLVPALIKWPRHEELRLTLPIMFHEQFKNCVCIIDCFELFIERASDLKARAQTYSVYKSHNTIKYLIGITPQGTVSFISKGWGGRTSDKHITENSGFLDHLVPGDVVLADRGFDMATSFGLRGAKLIIPVFTKGKKQLPGAEVDGTRDIGSVRIHVERVIGLVRQKYTILGSTIPITLIKSDSGHNTLDKIVHVCCALTNLCKRIVPSE